MDEFAEKKMMAGVDTVSEFLELLSVLVKKYHMLLLKAGFSGEEAITIIAAYQDTVLGMVVGKHLPKKDIK